MQARFLLIFSLLLSANLWANSAVFVINDDSKIRSSKSEQSSKNILKIVNQNQQLQRLTMHYSGWSLVAVDDINGWILSSNVTSQAPIIKPKPVLNLDTNNEKYKIKITALSAELLNAENNITLLEQSNTKLIADISTLNASINTLTQDNLALNQAASVFKSATNLSEAVNTETLNPVNNEIKEDFLMNILIANWIYFSVAIAATFLLISFLIVNRNRRRHFDLNSLRR
ncbi:MAG TPA: hypothetical protein EYO25_02130 [Candidatus Thioglobus sp.]|nr:hypothetical protein [Candidatus Thioglobus sp.]